MLNFNAILCLCIRVLFIYSEHGAMVSIARQFIVLFQK